MLNNERHANWDSNTKISRDILSFCGLEDGRGRGARRSTPVAGTPWRTELEDATRDTARWLRLQIELCRPARVCCSPRPRACLNPRVKAEQIRIFRNTNDFNGFISAISLDGSSIFAAHIFGNCINTRSTQIKTAFYLYVCSDCYL